MMPVESSMAADPDVSLVFIALGSNLGAREATLAWARAAIGALPLTSIAAVSSVEETTPLGPSDQPPYLNQMIAVVTALTPHTLLDALLEVERHAGRVRGSVRWTARTLDCDIVRYGDLSINDETLTVPHPELENRDFWQRELAELDGILSAAAS